MHSQSALVTVLGYLRGRGCLSPMKNVLISTGSNEISPIVEWLQEKQNSGAKSASRLDKTSRPPVAWATCEDTKSAMVRDILASMQTGSVKPEAEAALRVTALMNKPLLGQVGNVVTPVNMTLEALANSVRGRSQVSSSSSALLLGSGDHPMICGSSKHGSHLADDCAQFLCAPQSHDAVLCETLDSSTSTLEDCATVGSHALTRSGTLLVVLPTRPSRSSAALLRNIQWKFSQCSLGFLPKQNIHYLHCTSVAGDDVGRSVDRSSFPGFLPKGKRRERRWNPYQKDKKKEFVAFLRPSFTNAKLTRESLRNALDAQKEKEEALAQEEENFFSVAHKMVERREYSSRRDN